MFEPNVILYSLWQYIDHYILCMAIHMFYGNTLTTIYLIIFVYRPFWYKDPTCRIKFPINSKFYFSLNISSRMNIL